MWTAAAARETRPRTTYSWRQGRRSTHWRLLGACVLALLFSAEARVFCESHSAGTVCKRTQRDCIRDRADLEENCFSRSPEYLLMAFLKYLHTPGRSCDPWNVTVDPEHAYTPSFRPANVSVTAEVDSSSSRFRIYATWDQVEDANLHNYEVRVKQIQDESTFRTSYCQELDKEATEYQSEWHDLSEDRTVKVQVITSPYDHDTFDCNVHSLMFTVPEAYTGDLVNPHLCAPDNVQEITVHRLQQEVHLSWEALENKVYFISIIDPLISSQPNCRQPGENPPCFITKATNITIDPLNSSRKYLVNVDAYPECEGYEIMGVYSGCHNCCRFVEVPSENKPSVATDLDSARETIFPTPVKLVTSYSSLVTLLGTTATTIQKRIPHATIGLRKSTTTTVQKRIPHATIGLRKSTTTTVQKGIPHATTSTVGPRKITPLAVSGGSAYTSLRAITSLTIVPSSSSVVAFSSSVMEHSLEAPHDDVYKPSDTSTLWIYIPTVLVLVLFVLVTILTVCVWILVRRSKSHEKDGGREGEGGGKEGEGGGRGGDGAGDQESLAAVNFTNCEENEHRMGFNNGLQLIEESALNQLSPVQKKFQNKRLSDSVSPAKNSAAISHYSYTNCFPHVSSSGLHSYQTATPSVLVVYSPRCPAEDKHVLLQFLVSDLQGYNIRTTSHDWHLKGNIPMWIEQEVKRSTVVLCVCNRQFQQEWEQQVATDCKVVYAVQQLMYASLSQCEDLSSKFAVVLLRQSDRQFIPTQYLQSVNEFYVNEVKKIAHFVKQVPPYECSHSKDD